MSTMENATLASIPQGDWQLDVEPEVIQEHHQPVEEASPTKPVGLAAPSSTTPPPLHHILEALLFVASKPIPSEELCNIIRGLSAVQLDDTIRSLNVNYRRQGRPYTIMSHSTGYQLVLRTPFRFHLEELYGGVKEARFSQLAIETLAIIAYRQPISQEQTEGILGQGAGLPLRQLIRRGMIQLQGQDENQRPCYVTTARFLDYFALSKIEDLPRADDLERL